MPSVKLILVLIIVGVGLIVTALFPGDTNGTVEPTSLGSWVMGLLGVASLVAGLVLLRRGYLAARRAQGGGPMPIFAKIVLGLAGVMALAAIAFAVSHAMQRPATRTPGQPRSTTKADAIEQEQREIRRRQEGSDKPASAPGLPAHAFQ